MTPTRRHSENGRTMGTVKGSMVARGQTERGMRRSSKEEFQGSETSLHDTLMRYIHHSTLVEMPKMCSTQIGP